LPLLLDQAVSIVMGTPGVQELDHAVSALRGWQYDRGPLHLHPGDLGWHSSKGAAATAAAIRAWSRGGEILALGLLDGPQLLRMAVDPDVREDDELARQLVADVSDPQRGVLDAGSATIEARGAAHFSQLLVGLGWQADAPWTPFHRDLSGPVGDAGVRVEMIRPDRADIWVAVHWSAFIGTPFTEDDRRSYVDRWLTMAAGPLYAGARSLAAFDAHDNAVAVATVWSAGRGRPGLLEPMGVHRDHRGHGYGVAITLAAASALREMGSSSAVVCAESSNVGAVSTYAAAGFTAHEQVADLHRIA
jgi:GNAT superfamily N-acetyltransferase